MLHEDYQNHCLFVCIQPFDLQCCAKCSAKCYSLPGSKQSTLCCVISPNAMCTQWSKANLCCGLSAVRDCCMYTHAHLCTWNLHKRMEIQTRNSQAMAGCMQSLLWPLYCVFAAACYYKAYLIDGMPCSHIHVSNVQRACRCAESHDS